MNLTMVRQSCLAARESHSLKRPKTKLTRATSHLLGRVMNSAREEGDLTPQFHLTFNQLSAKQTIITGIVRWNVSTLACCTSNEDLQTLDIYKKMKMGWYAVYAGTFCQGGRSDPGGSEA
jgi:hypothetical protein